MMHSFEGLADEISTLLKKRGDTGDRGDNFEKANRNNVVAVTPCRASVSPLEIEGCHLVQTRGDGKSELNQSLAGRVTRVTPVTRNFGQGSTPKFTDDLLSEWHAVHAELQRVDSVDWLTLDRWQEVISDAESFLTQWGEPARSLGWTTLDLFGVHPIAPAARFDVMGLILLIHGGAVVALTAETATIRHRSGARLTFRRGDQSGAILISEVKA